MSDATLPRTAPKAAPRFRAATDETPATRRTLIAVAALGIGSLRKCLKI